MIYIQLRNVFSCGYKSMINLICSFKRRQLGYGHLLTSIVTIHFFNLLMPLSGVGFLQSADIQFIKALLSSFDHPDDFVAQKSPSRKTTLVVSWLTFLDK